MYQQLLAPGMSPNVEADDVWRAIWMIFQPWKWRSSMIVSRIELRLSELFSGSYIVTCNSARSALYTLLSVFGISSGDEVIVQAFTCVAAIEPILWCGAIPIYVDIDETYNIDPRLIEKKITKKTKAIVVQHTFGVMAKMYSIKKIAQKHNIILIEDCAHSLGASQNGVKAGEWGDGAVLSFGRDKVVSSVFGGAIVFPKSQASNVEKAKKIVSLSKPSMRWIAQQLFHPIAFWIIVPTYQLLLGKILLVLFQKIHFLSFPISSEEYKGKKPTNIPGAYCDALAYLLEGQLKKVDHFTQKRRCIAKSYHDAFSPGAYFDAEGSYLRYAITVKDPQRIYRNGKAKGILFGRWYSNIVDPGQVDLSDIMYHKGSCPQAEEMARTCINLPTMSWMSDSDIKRVLEVCDNVTL